MRGLEDNHKNKGKKMSKEYALEKLSSLVGLELKIYLEEKWEQGLKS